MILLYTKAINGGGYECGLGITVDGEGSAYVCGQAVEFDNSFPVTVGPGLTFDFRGLFDAYIGKLNPAGT